MGIWQPSGYSLPVHRMNLGGKMVDERELEEGMEFDLKVEAKGARGEGIGKIGNFVIFRNHAKTRIGNIYKVKLTKMHRTFGYAELSGANEKFIGNGSVIEL